MKLYIVRHGETLQNRSNIVQGQQPGNLSPLGLVQRERLAKRLADTPLDCAYSSDLLRTRDTIAPFAETTDIPIVYTELIRERCFGDLEGVPGKEYLAQLKETGLSRVEYQPPNGENFHDLQTRTDAFLNSLKQKHSGHDVLLMTHGGTIRALLSSLIGESLHDLLRMEIRNTSISTVSLSDDWTVLEHTLNDYSHLEGLEEPSGNSIGVDALQYPEDQSER